jgi:transposase
MPPQYGGWKTVYGRHRRWCADGTWVAVLDRLRQDCDREEGPRWTVGVDSTIVGARQHATGACHEAPALTRGCTELRDSRRGA